eukprot:1515415-Prymnesium_polylepis.2
MCRGAHCMRDVFTSRCRREVVRVLERDGGFLRVDGALGEPQLHARLPLGQRPIYGVEEACGGEGHPTLSRAGAVTQLPMKLSSRAAASRPTASPSTLPAASSG